MGGAEEEDNHFRKEVTAKFLNANDGGEKSKSPQADNCSRGTRTAAVILGFFAMGAGLAILGPTLISMELLHQTDTAGISWSFLGMRIGGLTGALLCGTLLDIINNELLLAVACYLAGAAMIAAPFTGKLMGFIILMGFSGVGVGFLDAACTPYMFWLWHGSRYRDSIMHVMSVFASLSQFLTPLIIRDFLVIGDDVTGTNATECHRISNPEINATYIQGNQNYTNHSYTGGTNAIGDLQPSNQSTTSIIDQEELSLSRYAYVIAGCIPLLGAILSTINFFILSGYKKLYTKKSGQGKDKECNQDTKRKTSYGDSFVILILLSVYMISYNWTESNPGAFLSSFVVKGLCMDIKTGSLITSIYWGCHGLGRLFTIFISRCVKPRPILYTLYVLYICGTVLGFFIPLQPKIVWGTAILHGLGASSFYFTTLLVISDYIEMTGKLSALCIVMIYTGGGIGPLFVANMFETCGYMWYIYIQTGAIVVQVATFFCIELYAKMRRLKVPISKMPDIDIDGEEFKNLNHKA